MKKSYKRIRVSRKLIRKLEVLAAPQISQIFNLHGQGKSISSISRLVGCTRKTVYAYLNGERYEVNGVYQRKPRPLMLDSVSEDPNFIRNLFERMEGNCEAVRTEVKRQLKIEVKGRTLRKYCSRFRREVRAKKSCNHFESAPGKQMQIDFGCQSLVIGGKTVKAHFFVGVLGYSRRIFVKAYPCENQLTWFDGITSAFNHFKGKPVEVVSDNARALATIVRGTNVVTETYATFARVQDFKPVLCSPGHPQSKGKVERAVGYVKQNALVGREFKSFQDLNDYLEQWCLHIADERRLSEQKIPGGGTPIQRFEESEEACLRLIKIPTQPLLEESRRVYSTGLICVNNNRYKLPKGFSDTQVEVLHGNGKICIAYEGKTISVLDAEADAYEPTVQTISHTLQLPKGLTYQDPRYQTSQIACDLKPYDELMEVK